MGRPRPTLADYVVIGINPLLIMTLVGSLVFFLLAVFYQGQFEARLHFIMAMFVMAAVLIGRISIDEGREYATLFAVPLALVTAIATFRFVEFHGALAAWSPLINLSLIALIWWSADRLTWDCTLIDESEDASGEGLLQTVGLEGNTPRADPAARGSRDLDGTTDRERAPAAAAPSPGLWEQFVQYRRRRHAPGVWVVYFSLAALPLFAIGQLSVRASGLEGRRHMFQLLVIYVASALGLLLTTSFLGLRRYLRQRRLAMPAEMAAVWLTSGAVMIAGILLLCLLLPRRNPEYSLTHLSWLAGSPDNLRTSRYGFGNDGPNEEGADRTGPQPGEATTENSQGGKSEGGKSEGGKTRDRSSSDSSSQADTQPQPAGSRKPDQGSGDPANNRQSESASDRGPPPGQEPSGNQSSGNQSSGDGQKPSAASQPESQAGQEDAGGQADRQQSPPPPSREKPSQGDSSAPRKSGNGQSQSKPQNGPKGQGRSGDQSSRPDQQHRDESHSGDSSAKQEPAASEDQADSPTDQRPPESPPENQTAANSPQSKPHWNPSQLLPQLGTGLGRLIRFLYWVAVIVIVGYFLWRYWAQVLEAVRNFARSLQEFWERLFGRTREAQEADAGDSNATAAPPPPFATYSDPFATGDAERWSREELLRYSFQAFEAGERGCPRSPEQTPSEFAQSVAGRERQVAREVLQVADLYNLSAYAGRGSSSLNIAPIRRLWQALRNEVPTPG